MTAKKILLEVCADTIDSALIAQSEGAHRIEFCNNLSEGGTTPSAAQIEILRKKLQIGLYVLIRPRGGDFLYNDIEYEVMKLDIHLCGKSGCNGVVIGILHSNGTVDMERCTQLIQIAKNYSMDVTFHRAFDRCHDLFQSMEDIIQLGCKRILTSGGKDTALEGADTIKQLIEKANGRISIMPGSGITPENVAELIQKTNPKELHGTFRSRYPSTMSYQNHLLSHPEIEYSIWRSNRNKIKEVMKIIF